MRIFIAGYQHETNTFAPDLADWAAFNTGHSFPAYQRGAAVVTMFKDINVPIGGFIQAANEQGWELIPSAWAGATPSSYVTTEAFERICGDICEDLIHAVKQGIDAVYLDLHGAAVAQNADDSEGELLARIRAIVGPNVPIVGSLDLHANVTERMLDLADALVSYRTYPHIDMADTGRLAAKALQRRFALGKKEPMHFQRFGYMIPLNAQSTWMQPAKTLYDHLIASDTAHDVVLNFCMGFPLLTQLPNWRHAQHLQSNGTQVCLLYSKPLQWPLLERKNLTNPSLLPIRKITQAPAVTATPPVYSMNCWPRALASSLRGKSR
jgi:microcystin degradation protein MlrC